MFSKLIKDSNLSSPEAIASFVERDIRRRIQDKTDAESNLKSQGIDLFTSSAVTRAIEGVKLNKEVEVFNFNAASDLSKQLYMAVEAISDVVASENVTKNQLIEGYFNKMKQLVNDGADVNLKSASEFTPLLAAALVGNAEAMQFFIEKGANTRARTFEEQTILHAAISSRDQFAVLLALTTGDQVNQRNFYSDTALDNAAMYQIFSKSIIELILADGADEESVDRASLIAMNYGNKRASDILQKHKLDSAALGEDYEINLAINKVVKLLEIKQSKEVLNFVEQDLVDGCVDRSINDVMKLAKNPVNNKVNKLLVGTLDAICGAIVNVISESDVSNRYTQSFGKLMDMALELVKIGADVNAKSRNEGFSLLHLASYFDATEMVDILTKDFSANLKEVTSNGNTILHLNSLNKDPKALDTIIDLASDLINSKRGDGNTALHMAAKFGFGRLAKRLIANGANLTLFNNDGDTALHLAAKGGLVKTTKMLIEAGCDVTDVNKSGKTPIQCAKQSEEMKKFLAPIVAELEAKDKEVKQVAAKEKAIKNLPKKMIALQRIAESKSFKTAFQQEDVEEMLSLINATNSESNLKTIGDWTPLHIAAKLGQSKIVTSLINKGFDVNATADGGLSVLHCAVQNEDSDTIKAVLNQTHSIESISRELKYIITSGNRQLLSNFIHEESVACQFEPLTQKERNRFLEDCYSLANNLKSGVNTANIKSDIRRFINSLANEDVKEEVSKEVCLSKNAKKRIAKERNAAKAEEEAEAKRMLEEKKLVQAKESAKMLAEDVLATNLRYKDETMKKGVYENKKSTQDEVRKIFEDKMAEVESIKMINEDILSSRMMLREKFLNAKSFIPESEREKLQKESWLKEQQRQMRHFLESDRNVNHITDLPSFMRPIIEGLLEQDHRVFLKGSAIYQRGDTDRVPVDLDVEVMVKGMNKWNNEKINNFVKKNFDLDTRDEHIFRGQSKGEKAFSVNIKDAKRGLDISFYDPNLKPHPELSWIVSREEKVFFKKDERIRRVKPEGFSVYLRENNIRFNPKSDLLINSSARGLILRLSFLETISHITKDEIEANLACSIHPANPIDLLFKELKMDKRDFVISENKELEIKSSINRFLNSHKLDEDYRLRFLSNLSDMISISPNPGIPNHGQYVYYSMMRDVVEEMKSENKKPPSPITNNRSDDVFKLKDKAVITANI